MEAADQNEIGSSMSVKTVMFEAMSRIPGSEVVDDTAWMT